MPVSGWIDKQTAVQLDRGVVFCAKKLMSYQAMNRHGRTLNAYDYGNENCHSEKTTYFISTIWHYKKGKIMKATWLQRITKEEGVHRQSANYLRVVDYSTGYYNGGYLL